MAVVGAILRGPGIIQTSLTAVLRERASLQPHDPAFTFVDYDSQWDGVAEELTWAQLYRRVADLAAVLRERTAPGDRAAVLAPQNLHYVIGYLAALEAGLIAVPLSTPAPGFSDERVLAVLADAAPTVLLTDSAAAAAVAAHAGAAPEATIIEVDRLPEPAPRAGARRRPTPEVAYLQYTSGSTRTPAGVMVSHANLVANYRQMIRYFFPHHGGVAPADTTVVSWLPFYHDMGLLLGVCAPILGGWHTVFTSPLAFLARPARWLQLLAAYPSALTAAPNFAFDLAAARVSDDDLPGADLSSVLAVMNGAERVLPGSMDRFTRRFAPLGLSAGVIRPSYGLAEATLYVATAAPAAAPTVVSFDPDLLAQGQARRSDDGTALVGYGTPDSPAVRIVDPQTRRECADGTIGEIWVRGDNVCQGYWNKPEETARTFGGIIVDPAPGTPDDNWLCTGDLGFLSAGELFIVGRIKDLLIVRGRNHYPDDIEATVTAISGCRSAAIVVQGPDAEELVAIVETKNLGQTEAEIGERLAQIENSVHSAISESHGIVARELVLVSRGAIPLTTSGKIRRQACVERYASGTFERVR